MRVNLGMLMLACTVMYWLPTGTSKHFNTNKLCPNLSNLSLSTQGCSYYWELGLIALGHILQLFQNSHCIYNLVAFWPVPSLTVSRHCTIAWKKACWRPQPWQHDAKRALGSWATGRKKLWKTAAPKVPLIICISSWRSSQHFLESPWSPTAKPCK